MEIRKQTASTNISDAQVIERVMNGDKGAYELVMRKYNPRLFRIVRTYLKDEDDIEDIIQESYIKAYEQLPRFEKRSSFSTWLIRIAINEALSRIRQRKRFASMADDDPEDTGPVRKLPAQLTNKDTPMEKLMNTELKEILEKAVEGLPEKYRAVFVMREIEDMSIAETSASLAISKTNVKVRLNRAKEMLRDSISESYHDADVFHFNLVRCDRIVDNVLRRIEAYRS